MADLNTPISDLGSQTEPAKMAVSLSSAASKVYERGRPFSSAYLPEIRAVAFANGIDPLRLSIKGNVYNVGLLPPDPIDGLLTVAGSGTQASATLETASYVIADGDTITLGPSGTEFRFLNSFSGIGNTYVGIKRESTTAATLEHLRLTLIGEGVDYTDYRAKGPSAQDLIEVQGAIGVTSYDDLNTLVLYAIEYGTSGNAYVAALGTGTWTGSSLGTGGFFSGGAAGTTPGVKPGTYRYAYTYFRSSDLAESQLSEPVSITIDSEQEIDLSALDDGPDADYDLKRIYRTTVSGVEFRLIGEVADGTTTYTDTKTDEDLVAFGNIPFDIAAHRDYYAGHIPKYRVVAPWKGRLWGGGAVLSADYTIGTVKVTINSATVTATALGTTGAPLWNSQMVGRRFRVTNKSHTETYRIISVDEALQTMKLDHPYQGASSTNNTATYEIVDDRDTTDIGCSESGLPNLWPADNQITGVRSGDPEGIVGIMPFGDYLFWFCRDGIWRLTGGSVESWQLTQVVSGSGAVAQPITVPGGMVWLGVDGIYAWSGAGQPERVSSPRVQGDRVTGIDGTIERITEGYAHLSHAVYDPEERAVRFFVPLDGAYAPSHAIVLDLSASGTFSLDESPDITCSALVPDSTGDHNLILGDLFGFIWQAGTPIGTPVDYHIATAKNQDALAIPTKDNLEGDFTDATGKTRFRIQKRGLLHKHRMAFFVTGDGVFGAETVLAVVSSTARTITVAGSSFSTDQCAGAPIWVIRDTGATEIGKVISNTDSVLTVARDLTYEPDSNDQIAVGAIFCDMETGRYDMGDQRRLKSLMDIFVNHSPGAAKLTGYTLAVRASGEHDT